MDVRNHEAGLKQLAEFVHDECQKRLKAYEAQPRDAAEHFETENEVLSGGYAYRQLYELVQNAADATGRRRAVVSLPTGGGKTRVAAEAAGRFSGAEFRCGHPGGRRIHPNSR